MAGAGSLAVHAEEFRPGDEVLHGDSPEVAARCAEVFAQLMAELAGDAPLSGDALRGQAAERLRRANA